MDARRAIDAGKGTEAISTIDKVIGYYESKHPDGKHRWFVARTPEETLAYLMISAADMDKGVDNRNATSLYATAWSEAYYMKGYVLVELDHPQDAKEARDTFISLQLTVPF